MSADELPPDPRATDTILQLFESIRDGSAFEGSTPTKWVEASVCFSQGVGGICEYGELGVVFRDPGELASGWGYLMSPFQIALLRDAELGKVGRGIVIIHDYGCIVELETWPAR